MKAVHLDLHRTFVKSPAKPEGEHVAPDEDFSNYLADGRLQWKDLLAKPLVVVLGEAGSGKTWEFQDQAKRLRSSGLAAFFIPLNKVTSRETFKQALGRDKNRFRAWTRAREHAYFFLDAVDESRLQGAGMFELSLQTIMGELGVHAARVSVLLSSRISDWLLTAVRSVVDTAVLSVMAEARSNKKRTKQADGSVVEQESDKGLSVEAFTLAPLSATEAKRLAAAHGAKPVAAFWGDIQDGDYGYMVRHPRDVEWLARRWAQRRELGSYIELVEDGVAQRLKEHNDGYIAAGAVLSQEMLRAGAERLAAASVFCAKPFVSLPGEKQSDTDVDPAVVLAEWDAKEQRRLLGVAVFDEATYGRVKFQHRSTREYLAAQWVHRLIGEGLPVPEALQLFGGKPYEEPVLLNSTRATLCWLAALNVSVREQVILNFPEMLMFEGDPTAWTEAEVVDAFQRYIVRLEAGFRPDWWNGLGEQRRVARCIPAWLLSQMLRSHPDSYIVTPKVMAMVYHGRKGECADDVFAIYRRRGTSSRTALYALHMLSSIATQQQRDAIKSDLLNGRVSGNEYMAAAIEVVGLARFTVNELSTLFARAIEEQDYGGGPMARVVNELVADCSFEEAMSLIEALLNALPHRKGRRVRAGEVESKDRWKLHVLPACVTRAVDQLGGRGAGAPALLYEAALYLEEVHQTSHVTNEQFARLVKAVEAKPKYRHDLILTVARNGSLDTLPGRLFMGSSCQLNITPEGDLAFAVEGAISLATDQPTRWIWFRIAEWLSYRTPAKRRSRIVKRLLSVGDEERKQRSEFLAKQVELAKQQALEQAKWRDRDARDAQKKAKSLETNKRTLTKCIGQLRTGEHFGAIQFLVGVADERHQRGRYTQIDPSLVQREFGRSIASAFDKGLTRFWKRHDAPDVLKYENNEVPWTGLLGLASLNHAVRRGLDVTALSEAEVEQAVRYCVWELEQPPEWFETIARARSELAIEALRPWVEHELTMTEAQGTSARTVELVFRSPPEIRVPLLKQAVEMGMRGGISKQHLSKRVFEHALDDGALDTATANRWVQSVLVAPHEVVRIEAKQAWLSVWFEFDVAAAWAWVSARRTVMRTKPAAVAVCVGRAISSRSKRQDSSPARRAPIATLESLYTFLSPYIATELDGASTHDQHWHPVEQARNWTPAALAGTEGAAAHEALLRLKFDASSEPEAHWLQTFVLAHAVAEAQRFAKREPGELVRVGDGFCQDPRTAAQLCQQVMARLTQIRTSVESGPFSDRLLFQPGMPEKHLQLWLAARLNDTPNRRFSARFVVHREPEVDNTKRTDVEVSSRGFKVCIEVKPIDKKRYSAADLRDTLERQLVKQYLKGGSNSRHGVLVLLLLEDKQWNVPGVGRRAGFEQLIAHLSNHAQNLRVKHSAIEALLVIGIDCRHSV